MRGLRGLRGIKQKDKKKIKKDKKKIIKIKLHKYSLLCSLIRDKKIKMTSIDIDIYHDKIKKKLDYFIEKGKIPNIIFYGQSGSGKKTLLKYFLDKIYEGQYLQEQYIMNVNCAHGKGIKFIRDEMKFFAKTNINLTLRSKNTKFPIPKSIILLNAEQLTIDAQSALRRCIELFSTTTRFFIVTQKKEKLLKPIISRFCDIYVPRPKLSVREIMRLSSFSSSSSLSSTPSNTNSSINININIKRTNSIPSTSQVINIHQLHPVKLDMVSNKDNLLYQLNCQKQYILNNILEYLDADADADADANVDADKSIMKWIYSKIELLIDSGISGIDLIQHIERNWVYDESGISKYIYLIHAERARNEIKNEKLLLWHLLTIYSMRKNIDLENIYTM